MKVLHHANIILSEDDGREIVFDMLAKNLNFTIHQNPDFLLLEDESFGIDEARGLEIWALGKPFVGNIKVCLLISKSLSTEAQNALLKTLEEPPIGTYFFINIKSLANILPTLLSRAQVLDFSKTNVDKDNARTFLQANLKQKFIQIKNLAKIEMKDLIYDLEKIAYNTNTSPQSLKNILTAKVLSSARGSSSKMLLEWLACVL